MDRFIVQGGLLIERGGLLRIEDGRGMLLQVLSGALWLTQPGDRRDHHLRAGQRFRIERAGALLAQAIDPATLALGASLPRYYARRIAVRQPGMHAPRVLYDRAQEPGGWLARLRGRVARARGLERGLLGSG